MFRIEVMNNNDSNIPFIFFITLEDHPPKSFYIFDKLLREFGFILIPVKVDQLQGLIASSEQNQVIVLSSVTNFREYRIFNDKVRGLLKFILKSKRLTFMNLSSFSKLNDNRQFAFYKNYYFLRYPLEARTLASQIARYYELKLVQNTKWPGGKRAGTQSVIV